MCFPECHVKRQPAEKNRIKYYFVPLIPDNQNKGGNIQRKYFLHTKEIREMDFEKH